MVKSIKSGVKKYDTDRVAIRLYSTLARDFRASFGDAFCSKAENMLKTDISSYRDYTYPELGYVAPSYYKAMNQMQSLFKKYRFKNDKYDDEQLRQRTLEKYFADQKIISVPKQRSVLGHRVLQKARQICRSILGKIDYTELITLCRFGRKSSIGCPLAFAYIDYKLTNVKAFTGSKECSKWFNDNIYNNDVIIKELRDALIGCPNLEHESLNLINVPKTWKVDRNITPLTLITLFYSYGVGGLISSALSKHGLDISRLQSRHRRLIKGYSKSCSHATADLSRASDSLTSWLINSIMPREWYNAVKKTFTRQLMVNDVLHYTESILPMGNGLTFPVETLIFYCIIRAVGTLANVHGTFSVYGDDLIYPSKLHKYVVRVFDELGLVLNLDKTYVHYPFRESCGSDYYHGVDVRAFYLQGIGETLGRQRYAAFLYKIINGLCRRWDPSEIRSTLYMLIVELATLGVPILRVPPSFPDYSGIKVNSVYGFPLDLDFVVDWSPIRAVFFHGSRWYSFRCLQETPDKRVVLSQLPYYWLSLQGTLQQEYTDDSFWKLNTGWFYHESAKQALSWDKFHYVRVFRDRYGRQRKKRLTKYRCVSPSRSNSKMAHAVIKPGSISDWI